MATDDSPPALEPKRRRFQFSLRLLFLITALWAVILGWWSVRRECRELNTVASCGVQYKAGTVRIICDYSGKVLNKRSIASAVARVADKGPVDGIDIGYLYGCGYTVLTPDAWQYVHQLKLNTFSIDSADDSDIPEIEKLSSLRDLTIRCVGCDCDEVDAAKRLRRALPHCRITIGHTMSP